MKVEAGGKEMVKGRGCHVALGQYPRMIRSATGLDAETARGVGDGKVRCMEKEPWWRKGVGGGQVVRLGLES